MAKGKTLNQLLEDKVMYLRKSISFQLQFQQEAAKKAREAVGPETRISWSTLDDLASAAAVQETHWICDKLLGQFDAGKVDLMDACWEINSYAMTKVLSGATSSQGSSQGGNMIRSYETEAFARLLQDSDRWIKFLMDDADKD